MLATGLGLQPEHATKTGVLEGLDVILVDDLDGRAIELLQDRAAMLENVQVPAIEPVAESTAATCTGWHLKKLT